MADSVKLSFQDQTHNSDSLLFSIKPLETLPPPPPLDWQWWWFAIPVALAGLGAAYLAMKK